MPVEHTVAKMVINIVGRVAVNQTDAPANTVLLVLVFQVERRRRRRQPRRPLRRPPRRPLRKPLRRPVERLRLPKRRLLPLLMARQRP